MDGWPQGSWRCVLAHCIFSPGGDAFACGAKPADEDAPREDAHNDDRWAFLCSREIMVFPGVQCGFQQQVRTQCAFSADQVRTQCILSPESC